MRALGRAPRQTPPPKALAPSNACQPLVDIGIYLIEGHRGLGAELVMELPAGAIDVGEQPVAAAHRELMEETGLIAGRLDLIYEFVECPGLSDATGPFCSIRRKHRVRFVRISTNR